MSAKIQHFQFLRSVLLFLGLNLGLFSVQAQSLAYKTLLETLYEDEMDLLRPEEIQDLSSFQILDTREREEYDVSHLKNAIWVGYEDFDLERVSKLDIKKPVLVYCTVGARSQDIGLRLKEKGFEKVYNLYGGIIHWVNEDEPVFTEGIQTNQVHTYSFTWGVWLNKGEKVYD